VEIVRRFLAPYEGEDLVPHMREAVERLGPDFQPNAVLAYWAEDPGWQHVHPDIEWDVRAAELSSTAHGPREVAMWFADWVGVWESQINHVVEYRDLGDWVLVLMDMQARGREDIAVEMRRFQLYRVREGKVAVCRSFHTEREALKAVGLAE
jgi:hypothetical protein